MNVTRRDFLLSCGAAAASFPAFSLKLAYSAPPSNTSNTPLLLHVFLRGGMDGLQLIAPLTDPYYIAARPQPLRVNAHGKAFVLDNAYGEEAFFINPRATALHQLYQQGYLAVIHACGLTHETRSHFEASDMIERGTHNKMEKSGWLSRLFNLLQTNGPQEALAMGNGVPTSLLGCSHLLPLVDQWSLDWPSSKTTMDFLRAAYDHYPLLGEAALNALDVSSQMAASVLRDSNQQIIIPEPPRNINYGEHSFGQGLKFLAHMVQRNPLVNMANIELDGWDTHEQQSDHFGNLLETLSQGVRAFFQQMNSQQRNVLIVVHSEFGRRLKANESGGTDHGHGNVMLVIGQQIKGGRCYGAWPGLATEQLSQQADLQVTTDYRHVLASLLPAYGLAVNAPLFPDFSARALPLLRQ
ncbi:MAG: DUF1501 domain-containing protein [Alphaproteobacteria bacterium]